MAKITVVGSFVVDMVARVQRFPIEGETLLGKSLRVYLGGKGANQCVAIKRLGVDVEMIGMVGNDNYGQMFLELFRKEGIVCDKILVADKEPTAMAQIQIDENARNKIVVMPSSNYEFSLENLKEIECVIKNTELVVTQLELNNEVEFELVRMCNRLNVPIILNPAPAIKMPLDILKMVDYLTPNEVELGILAGMPTDTLDEVISAAKHLISIGVKNIVSTLGSKGALVANKDGINIIPGYKVNVVDTVGAGDSFNGALAKGIVEGRSIEEAVKFANAMGALTVTVAGAIPSLHTLIEVEEFIEKNRCEN